MSVNPGKSDVITCNAMMKQSGLHLELEPEYSLTSNPTTIIIAPTGGSIVLNLYSQTTKICTESLEDLSATGSRNRYIARGPYLHRRYNNE